MTVGVSAFYGPGDDIVELTPSNFHSRVINSNQLWIVEFYAPWCGHCQALAPEWKTVARALKGIVRVGAVDADKYEGLGDQYKVESYPNIKFFGEDKFKPVDCETHVRTASGIIDFSIAQTKSTIKARLSAKKTGAGGGGGKAAGDPSDVVEITDDSFDEEVLQHDGLVLLEFYAPWCTQCKSFAPHWIRAATQLKGKVKVCAVDATVNRELGGKYGVRNFPAIKWFAVGHKDGEAEDYDGGRTSSDIVKWALDKLADASPPPEVYQVTSSEVMKENCEGHQMCIISVLPHIYDCQAQCRNNYLHILRKLADRFKKHPWGWLWSEAGAQKKLEETLEVGNFGYPVLVALNTRKLKFSQLRGQFSEKGIHEFLRDLSYGKGSTLPVKNSALPDIETYPPWDGKDAELPTEEDIDLSDVQLEDLDKTEL